MQCFGLDFLQLFVTDLHRKANALCKLHIDTADLPSHRANPWEEEEEEEEEELRCRQPSGVSHYFGLVVV